MIYEALSSSKTNVTKEYRTKKFKLINIYCYIYWSKDIQNVQDIKKTLKINLKSGGKEWLLFNPVWVFFQLRMSWQQYAGRQVAPHEQISEKDIENILML